MFTDVVWIERCKILKNMDLVNYTTTCVSRATMDLSWFWAILKKMYHKYWSCSIIIQILTYDYSLFCFSFSYPWITVYKTMEWIFIFTSKGFPFSSTEGFVNLPQFVLLCSTYKIIEMGGGRGANAVSFGSSFYQGIPWPKQGLQT